MGRARALISASIVIGFAVARDARAETPCERADPGTGSPIRVPVFGPADLGTAQEACARTRVALETRAALLVAESDFYGMLLAGATLRGTLALSPRAWLSLWLPGPEWRYVANATVDASRGTLGAGAAGAHATVFSLEALAVAVHGRVLLPTETILTNATRYGGEAGVTALYRPGARVEVPVAIAVPFTFTAAPGAVTTLVFPSFSADVVYRPARAFAAAIGAAIRPAESFDPRVELRLYPYEGLGVRVGALFPVAGADRTFAAVSLGVGWEGP